MTRHINHIVLIVVSWQHEPEGFLWANADQAQALASDALINIEC